MGRYQFYYSKIEKDDKQTLYAFFGFKVKFYGLLEYNKNWDVGRLDGVIIRF